MIVDSMPGLSACPEIFAYTPLKARSGYAKIPFFFFFPYILFSNP
jgi:hypothetical protein